VNSSICLTVEACNSSVCIEESHLVGKFHVHILLKIENCKYFFFSEIFKFRSVASVATRMACGGVKSTAAKLDATTRPKHRSAMCVRGKIQSGRGIVQDWTFSPNELQGGSGR